MEKTKPLELPARIRESLQTLLDWYWDEALEDFEHGLSEFPDSCHTEHPFVAMVDVVGWMEGREVYPMDFVIEQAAGRSPALYWEEQP